MPHFQQRPNTEPVRVLVADANRSEHLLLTMAAAECRNHVHFDFVRTGDELLGSLTNAAFPTPDLLLLDLHLPRVDAQTVLISLGLHDGLSGAPVIVLAPDPASKEAQRCYAFGAFHVEKKPDTFGTMVELIDHLTNPACDQPIRPFDLNSLARSASGEDSHTATQLRAFDVWSVDDLSIELGELDGGTG